MFWLTLILLAAAPAAAQEASTQAVTVEQLYRPASTRDPLIPSTVYGDSKAQKAATAETAKSSFSVHALSLSGVMEDSRGKQALLKDAAAGAVYVLRAGRLYDSRKKMVPGVTGVIRGKQVILMTDDKKMIPLALREKDGQ